MEEALGDRDDRAGGDLSRHRRRRSSGRCARRPRHHEADRLQGAACWSSTTRWSRSRRARRGSRAWSSSPAPDRSPTAATPRGEAARAGGWGYVLGDEGSGYWIGRAALRAVLREADRRGPTHACSPLLLQHFGVDAGAGPDPRGVPHATCSRPRSARSRSACRRPSREGDAGRDRHPARGRPTSSRRRPCRSRAGSTWSASRSRSCSPAASSARCRG